MFVEARGVASNLRSFSPTRADPSSCPVWQPDGRKDCPGCAASATGARGLQSSVNESSPEIGMSVRPREQFLRTRVGLAVARGGLTIDPFYQRPVAGAGQTLCAQRLLDLAQMPPF